MGSITYLYCLYVMRNPWELGSKFFKNRWHGMQNGYPYRRSFFLNSQGLTLNCDVKICLHFFCIIYHPIIYLQCCYSYNIMLSYLWTYPLPWFFGSFGRPGVTSSLTTTPAPFRRCCFVRPMASPPVCWRPAWSSAAVRKHVIRHFYSSAKMM